MFKSRNLTVALAALTLVAGLAGGARAKSSRILALGDSLMAMNGITGHSIADYLRRSLGAQVVNRSVPAAHMVYRLPITGSLGMSIPAQFRKSDRGWDWVVMTGGGNDLWLGCQCAVCDRRIDKMISADGTRGEIPQLFHRVQQTGAQVVYVGYLRSPGIRTPIEHCKDEGDELEARIARLAARVPGVHYVSLHDLVPPGDTSYFAIDGIHPSVKASREIAARVVALMTKHGARPAPGLVTRDVAQ
ncbi:SGNH/GDSL hydrolase family protein [Psychromarinibacter sp. C21-152]|uniref:SGNH/GDSL hydrolase family protein n=1 Tax=Psychromarinibacter sediminicola TaxID=3033385 RepID=A0AAE3NT77_9RHOB|nr:SGNH/GDSL hydrolase family protein [Psychromarinibacter sediminicola]MDF0601576.1 SGNH/GDSL hydrolase family protein [Psychromarinibacter sediminicola]